MKLNTLQLEHYRNYEYVMLDCHPEVNILIGENAQGKTNLLESIYTLALAKSHRTTNDNELIRFNKEYGKIEGELSYRHGVMPLTMFITKKGKKVKVNHIEQSRLTKYIGHLNVVLFAPEDLNIVKGSPQIRRRFIDMELGQISALYLNDLSQYQRILKQKNHYLKKLQIGKTDDTTMLEILNQQFAEYALSVTRRRQRFVDELQKLAKPIHSGITNNQETLSLKYQPSVKIEADDEATQYEALLETLNNHITKEKERGVSVIGPHRDDLSFNVNGMDAKTYGSQGQQRTTALSIKLAEIELMNQEVGEYPILLLDDVLSELDDSRQTHLLTTIQHKVQTFVTTTSVDGIDHEIMKHAKLYRINQGEIMK
ncbi:DNA replication/repair protein RecF [Staphylococcus massiliensis]|uniref:DNA replication and repair protein RecF n=1 Tax=Staphylococcus massiliensis S46 TaxID=1229783 RepID=K9B301_9STAP|nr:DNA replication/repair protein RecF [Staphylococcus massiliensis]EKU48160.1 recombination protein F [Staphylococcus massiliensis S46]MCG3399579.1 DNA replication/repair protein RecF [Staphylococcus massiliensis]MCG3402089.1 DNA replication/repair protein RecF [Staphylococcus massiliensis]MCG3412960.1 DNA replication/repair protein RecF [Staphylococcus massiliensis]POA00974.1 DNA replication and repair protein RecF [Staphylococcus massiliensis CCUG 55927]